MSELSSQTPSASHVAIIMDGNGRWAQSRGRPRLFGHHAGAKRIREILESCPELAVKYLTIFAFSTENWKRTQEEVAGLITLFRRYIIKEAQNLKESGVRVRFIGDRMRLETSLVDLMDNLELMTCENDLVHLTIAINYGGRDELARATRRLAYDVKSGRLSPKDINEKTLPKYLDTFVLPDPDLLIRTSGEARISNFLLWQAAYSEYDFVDTLWPDFTREMFALALGRYQKRVRKFGDVLT
ncbi:polyprenyl diphosphate synthase [Paracoccaceae bacterium]|jgi:undecaprenyl diphosphate synthase|nr:polyprenyl diphosphate synthase [Paracoccaceae bacterium]